MELHDIPAAFQTRLRMAIISALVTGEKTFNELKSITQSTDGNLSVQLMKLEEYGCVLCSKAFVKRKPRTTYTLTEPGRQQFVDYVNMLEKIMNTYYNEL